jgi:hypothetical protein
MLRGGGGGEFQTTQVNFYAVFKGGKKLIISKKMSHSQAHLPTRKANIYTYFVRNF